MMKEVELWKSSRNALQEVQWEWDLVNRLKAGGVPMKDGLREQHCFSELKLAEVRSNLDQQISNAVDRFSKLLR